MKKTQVLLYSLILTLFLCAAVSAQKDSGQTLAPDAPLADTQAWLVKVIGKNATYHIGPTKKSITEIKFDGCSLSYTMRAETYQIADGALPTDSGEDKDDLSSKASGDDEGDVSLGENGAAVIKFSFADMNPATLAVQAAHDSNKMKGVMMESQAGKNAVSVSAKGAKNAKGTTRPSITVTVKDTVAESLKSGLAHAIALCEAPK
jgi:hypothetical protein